MEDEAAADVNDVMAALEQRRAEVDAERLAAQRHETEVLHGYAAAVAATTRRVSELETTLTAARATLAHAIEHRRVAAGALLALLGAAVRRSPGSWAWTWRTSSGKASRRSTNPAPAAASAGASPA